MRIGISAPQTGRLADPAAIRATAAAAEQVGYASLWVLDRLLVALEPRDGYGGQDGVPIPSEQSRTLDPLLVLACVATTTRRVRIGTAVLVAPWYRPALLARSLTTLDVLSEGRLTVGMGVGWSTDEYDAVNVDIHRRGQHLEEILDVLDAHWGEGPIRHDGPLARIVPAGNLLRPVQRPRPAVLLAAFTPAAQDRVARRADGWMPTGFPIDVMAELWTGIRAAAAGYGRDPDALEMVVRADIKLTDRAIDGDRHPFAGSFDQVVDDIEATRRAGAAEVILTLAGDPCLDESLEVCARIAETVGTGSPLSAAAD
jgi:probable F420-dependent oxidoreductase